MGARHEHYWTRHGLEEDILIGLDQLGQLESTWRQSSALPTAIGTLRRSPEPSDLRVSSWPRATRTCDIDALSGPALQSSTRFSIHALYSSVIRSGSPPLPPSNRPRPVLGHHVIPEDSDDNRIPLLDADTPKTTRLHTSTVTPPCNLPRVSILSNERTSYSCTSRANSSATYRYTTYSSSPALTTASARCVSPSSTPRKHHNNPQPESLTYKSDQRRYTANCPAS